MRGRLGAEARTGTGVPGFRPATYYTGYLGSIAGRLVGVARIERSGIRGGTRLGPAYLHREPGWEVVREVVGSGYVGTVNWCEVAQKSAEQGLGVVQVRTLLEEVGLMIVPFSAQRAEAAAVLWSPTRNHGLSLADRACFALGLENRASVLTADRAWAELDLGLDIRVVR